MNLLNLVTISLLNVPVSTDTSAYFDGATAH